MITSITVNNITGASPYNIYLCDYPETTCVFIATVSSLPYTFTIPPSMSTYEIFELKVIDDNGCETLNYLDCNNPTDCTLMPQYLGYDYILGCRDGGANPDFPLLSVQFHIKPAEVLGISSLFPCNSGDYPTSDCPLGTVDYSIDGGSIVTTQCEVWGGFQNSPYTYVLGCEIATAHIESYIDLTDYEGLTVTIDYTVTYPTTPTLTFTQSLTVTVPTC
jgi:hypothetical protein